VSISRRDVLRVSVAGAAGLAAASALPGSASATPAPAGVYAHNVVAVGYCDLADRPAFKRWEEAIDDSNHQFDTSWRDAA
jgi:hypothetical protein